MFPYGGSAEIVPNAIMISCHILSRPFTGCPWEEAGGLTPFDGSISDSGKDGGIVRHGPDSCKIFYIKA